MKKKVGNEVPEGPPPAGMSLVSSAGLKKVKVTSGSAAAPKPKAKKRKGPPRPNPFTAVRAAMVKLARSSARLEDASEHALALLKARCNAALMECEEYAGRLAALEDS